MKVIINELFLYWRLKLLDIASRLDYFIKVFNKEELKMAYIEKRGKNSFRLVVDIGFDVTGKRERRYRTVKCKNKTEAKAELAKFIVEVESGEYIAPQKMLFSSFVDEWKEKYARKQLAPKTYENYLYCIKQRILPIFGNKRVDQITTFHILNFLEDLGKDGVRSDGSKGGLSSASIQFYHRVLKNIFTRCVEWKVIKENPVSSIKKPKVQSKKARVFTEEQVKELMSHLAKEDMKWKMIVTFAITTGMRRGEILGLEWRHIDLERKKIYVKQALSYTKEDGYIFKETKNKNSVRTTSISDGVVNQLKKYKLYKKKEKLRTGLTIEENVRDLLFSTTEGLPMYPSSISSWWKERLMKYDLPHIRFHELRHTSATLLINQGVHMKTISARLGHSRIGTTMDLYGQALESADEKAADLLENIFIENKKEQA